MIQWFPGHMAKAKREIEASLALVDIVIELVDARIPLASQNPLLKEVVSDKNKLIVLMKKDLADPHQTDKWLAYFQKQNERAIAVDVNNKSDITKLVELVYEKGLENQQDMIKKGVRERAVRALIAGIPNVGKSTLINRLANKKIAKIGDRPGITKMQQWIKVRGKFELLDTPGMLWPKFEDEEIGLKLAAIGTIKHELTPLEDVAAYVIQFLADHYAEQLFERYKLAGHDDMWETFEQIGRNRGALESGGRVNFEKVAEIVLRDFRAGNIGRVTLDYCNE